MNPIDEPKSVVDVRNMERLVIDDAMKHASEKTGQRPEFGRMTAKPGFKGVEFTLEYPPAWPKTLIGRDGAGHLQFTHLKTGQV